jgi:hypothetical protein
MFDPTVHGYHLFTVIMLLTFWNHEIQHLDGVNDEYNYFLFIAIFWKKCTKTILDFLLTA